VHVPVGETVILTAELEAIALPSAAPGTLPSYGEPRTLVGGEDEIHVLAFTHDSRTLIAGASGTKRQLLIWDVASGRELRALDGPYGGTFDMAISPDGQRCATAHRSSIGIWNTSTWELERTLDEADFKSISFSSDGKRLTDRGRGQGVRGHLHGHRQPCVCARTSSDHA
jgi:WD40 repeat protein